MTTQAVRNPTLRGFHPTSTLTSSVGLSQVLGRAGLLILLVLTTAAATVALCPPSLLRPVTLGAAVATLVLGLVMAFSHRAPLPLLLLFILLDGVLVGGVSYLYESFYQGVVPLALGATTCTALVVVLGQAAGVLRTTPGLLRFVAYATMGYMVFWLVTLAASLLGFSFLALGSPLSLAVSLLGTFLATYSFLRDVEQVSTLARRQVSSRDGWYLAFSLVTTLVWLYLELLRLITNVRAFADN